VENRIRKAIEREKPLGLLLQSLELASLVHITKSLPALLALSDEGDIGPVARCDAAVLAMAMTEVAEQLLHFESETRVGRVLVEMRSATMTASEYFKPTKINITRLVALLADFFEGIQLALLEL